MTKIIATALLWVLYLVSCCGPRSNQSLPLLSDNFRGYIGSATDEFLINCWYKNQLLGKIYGICDSVLIFDSGVFIPNGRMISLCLDGKTTYDADFSIKVPYGDGVRFFFRSARKEFEKFPGIKFEFTPFGCSLFENNKLIAKVDSIKLSYDTPFRIFLQNEGSLVQVIVGIDTVWQGVTSLPLSECIYVEPINGCLKIEDVYFFDLLLETSYSY
ncbi:MAG: hypothetical protein ACUVQ1_05385 [Candidatus Kapaibacteriales bacterium]